MSRSSLTLSIAAFTVAGALLAPRLDAGVLQAPIAVEVAPIVDEPTIAEVGAPAPVVAPAVTIPEIHEASKVNKVATPRIDLIEIDDDHEWDGCPACGMG